MPVSESLFLSCQPGLEPALEAECKELGFAPRAVPGGVELDAPAGAYEVLNLWSACASRVLLRVATVRSPHELKDVSLAPYGKAFAIEGDGRFAAEAKRRWPHGDGPTISLREHQGHCTVSVDTSGDLLYLRGYRQEIGRAPLRETLAAGLLRLAEYHPAKPFHDVMCGSGTFVIEAALQALGKAPGAHRRFAFEQWPSHDAARFAARARQKTPPVTPPWLKGSDLNAGALGTARRNAKRAGVLEALQLERLDATKLERTAAPSPGLVLANLPYGIRVGDEREVPALVEHLNAMAARAFAGWRTAWLLPAGVKGEAHRKLPIQNGGIRCELWLTDVLA